MLLHETLHYCGSGRGTALKEGINEFLTRKITLENNFNTNGCGYPKEVKLAYDLSNLLGDDTINEITFINDDLSIYKFLEIKLGYGAANLYMNVSNQMELEFNAKYYSKFDNYSEITGIFKKTINYNKINYDKIYELMNEYKNINKKNK